MLGIISACMIYEGRGVLYESCTCTYTARKKRVGGGGANVEIRVNMALYIVFLINPVSLMPSMKLRIK